MESFRKAIRSRILPSINWLLCSFVFVIAGSACGHGVGMLSESMGWVHYPDGMFSGLSFFLFPVTGAILSLVCMHMIRILKWKKLDLQYRKVYRGWTSKNTLKIILFDELAWIAEFSLIWFLLIATL